MICIQHKKTKADILSVSFRAGLAINRFSTDCKCFNWKKKLPHDESQTGKTSSPSAGLSGNTMFMLRNMFIKLCGLTIVVSCVNIEQKEIFILDFSFYADVSSHGINNLSLYFTINSKPLRNRMAASLALQHLSHGQILLERPTQLSIVFLYLLSNAFLEEI